VAFNGAAPRRRGTPLAPLDGAAPLRRATPRRGTLLARHSSARHSTAVGAAVWWSSAGASGLDGAYSSGRSLGVHPLDSVPISWEKLMLADV
jgi:hypothetical protein